MVVQCALLLQVNVESKANNGAHSPKVAGFGADDEQPILPTNGMLASGGGYFGQIRDRARS
jgi:hypothetical protein